MYAFGLFLLFLNLGLLVLNIALGSWYLVPINAIGAAFSFGIVSSNRP